MKSALINLSIDILSASVAYFSVIADFSSSTSPN